MQTIALCTGAPILTALAGVDEQDTGGETIEDVIVLMLCSCEHWNCCICGTKANRNSKCSIYMRWTRSNSNCNNSWTSLSYYRRDREGMIPAVRLCTNTYKSLHDAQCVVARTIESNVILPGGGIVNAIS